uniref:Uncharacterized protein n=1 Tax=Hyaloperonospora arabidopsidis (strain Emoy2) TaxID=559515 RepID=M4C1Z2_HYAAE
MNTFQSGIASSMMEEAVENVSWTCLTAVWLNLVVAMEICLTAEALCLRLARKPSVLGMIAWE